MWLLLFATLGCCVFIWGLQYKLSLYDPPQTTTHHVPAAKLLSRDEQVNAHETSTYAQFKPAMKSLLALSNVLPLILFLVSAFGMRALSFQSALNQPRVDFRQALGESFFVRPPPVLLS